MSARGLAHRAPGLDHRGHQLGPEPDGRPCAGRDLQGRLRERAPPTPPLVAEPPPLAPDDLQGTGDRDVADALTAPGVDPDRDHPAGRAPRRGGGLDLDPPGGTGDLERVDHAVVGQVEDRARSITLRARRLEHGSWSSGSWMCRNTHPSRSTSPLRHTRHRTRFTTNREEPRRLPRRGALGDRAPDRTGPPPRRIPRLAGWIRNRRRPAPRLGGRNGRGGTDRSGHPDRRALNAAVDYMLQKT